MNEQDYQLKAEYSEDYKDRYMAVKYINNFKELERIAVSDVNSIVRMYAIERIRKKHPKKAEKILKENTPDFINEYYKALDQTIRENKKVKDEIEYKKTLERIRRIKCQINNE